MFSCWSVKKYFYAKKIPQMQITMHVINHKDVCTDTQNLADMMIIIVKLLLITDKW